MYAFFRLVIYFLLIFEIFIFTPIDMGPVTDFITNLLGGFFFFQSLPICKGAELVAVGITCIGTKAKKDDKFNVKTMVIYPLIVGGSCILICLACNPGAWGPVVLDLPLNKFVYVVTSIIGVMAIHAGLDNTSKYIRHKVGDDRFNFENESFKQETALEENKYSVNIPMIYYFKGKMQLPPTISG